MKEVIALIVYILLQILFIPFAIIGIFITAYKQLVVSKKLGVSQTAIEIINGRWTMHAFGMREDPGAAKLTPVLPNTSTFGLWLALFPLYVKFRISGNYSIYPVIAKRGDEGIGNLVMNRTLYFDHLIEKNAEDAKQIVILGAGLDTRAYGSVNVSKMKCFELDTTKNQQHKLKYLRKAGIDTNYVTYVEVDFNAESWINNLVDAGYNKDMKTIFLWEGVTLYLPEESVNKTIEILQSNSTNGSVILCDIYSRGFVSGEFIKGGKGTTKTLEFTNEELEFNLDMKADYKTKLETFITSRGLTLGESYFMGYNAERGPYAVVTELIL